MHSVYLMIYIGCIVLVKGQYFPPCPPGFVLPAVCVDTCASDADCGFSDFCCRASSCAVFCLPRPKPGTCPERNQLIGRSCRTDVDCDGKQKCCNDICTDPIGC